MPTCSPSGPMSRDGVCADLLIDAHGVDYVYLHLPPVTRVVERKERQPSPPLHASLHRDYNGADPAAPLVALDRLLWRDPGP